MLTDLPLRAIDEINATLAIIGYDEAWVLVEQRDDPITRIGQSLFKMARKRHAAFREDSRLFGDGQGKRFPSLCHTSRRR